jgi:CheY-like chemotaxis protein
MTEFNCKSILVVEDDELICTTIQYLLELEGYYVMTAPNGKVALEMLKSLEHPCLILLDLMLPIMNGWELLEVLRHDSKDLLAAIPIVITSAAGPAATDASRRVDGYIKKPIDIDLLLSTVKKYCGVPKASAA